MTQNIGDADRTLRIMAGVILAMIFFYLPAGTASLVVAAVAIVLMLSALTGWSLFYAVIRISTRSEKDAKPVSRS